MPQSKRGSSRSAPVVTPEIETRVGVTVADLAASYTLDAVKGFGPQKFKQLHEDGVKPTDIASGTAELALKGKRGDTFRAQIASITEEDRAAALERATRQIATAGQLNAVILTYAHPLYPTSVYASNNPIPVLYVRGAHNVINTPLGVACVGSRGIRAPYEELHTVFATDACRESFAVVSGFALGADSVGHRAARAAGGATICCMPAGLDRPFPPENRALWDDFLSYPKSVLVSEFPFGTRASSLTLRKRNKLIVAFARGVLISQSAADGGAMNAYRFALEQNKPLATFLSDGTADTTGNALIEEKRRHGDQVFESEVIRHDEYERWLRQLSSST